MCCPETEMALSLSLSLSLAARLHYNMTQGSLRKYDHGNFKKFIFQTYEKYCVGK